jgi:hypothetical protein
MLRIRGRYSTSAAHRAAPAGEPGPTSGPTGRASVARKLVVVIPYRDRAENLQKIVPALHAHLTRKEHRIVVVEQAGNGVFNKGRLLNTGFALHREENAYFCFHDVDLLPESEACDYSYPNRPTHLSKYCSQFDYAVPYARIFGGVVLFNRRDFIRVNGYSNEYWGWGCEDDDIARRIERRGLTIARREGRYTSLPHTRGWNQESTPDAYRRNRARLRGKYLYGEDGLTSLRCPVLEVREEAGFSRYLVDVGSPLAPSQGVLAGYRGARRT